MMDNIMADETKQPGIKFDAIILVAERFWRDLNVPGDSEISFNVEMSINTDGETATTQLLTTLIMKSLEKEVLKLESTFVGLFSVDKENENMEMEYFLRNNSPAVMFPYIREHIAAITQKSGVGSVLLPPINIVALIGKNKL